MYKNKFKNIAPAVRRAAMRFLPSVLAFFFASLAAAVLVAAFGYSPWLAFVTLFHGAVGDSYSLSESLLKTIPLLFTGLAVSLAFRVGVWNIGADGQFLMGALVGGAVALALPALPGWLLVPLCLLTGSLAGALWAVIAGVLREKRGVSEVITTIMLNVVAVQLLGYAVHGPLQEAAGTYPQSDRLVAAGRLPQLVPGMRLHIGILLALAGAGLLWLLLFRLPLGFRLRAIGQNPVAARFAGIAVSLHTIVAIALSGALAGLGGVVEVAGVTYRLFQNLSPGYGFTAIAVALLGRLHPFGVLPAAFLFGALGSGAKALSRGLGISPVLSEVIQAMVILFVVFFETRWFREQAIQWFFTKTADGEPLPAAPQIGIEG